MWPPSPAPTGSGSGLGYSAPLLITSFYACYQNWLGNLTPRGCTPVALPVLGGVLLTVGALASPETRQAGAPAPA